MIKKLLRRNRWTADILEAYYFSRKFLRPKGWFKSRRLLQSVDEATNPLPWFTYPSLHFIHQKLQLKPMKVFEFGSGNSTLWLAVRVESIISVENNSEFYTEMTKKLNSLDNVTYELKNLNENYHQKILEYQDEFDIIIIDGRERVECAKSCLRALKKDGVIIFDNSDRDRYKEAYDFLVAHQFKKIDFKGIGPIGYKEWQTSIYYRTQNCFEI